jgi:chorismate-pyruvate lyase
MTSHSETIDINTLLQDDSLSLFQKVLLATDGTVTQLLEIYSGSPIKVKKLIQTIVNDANEPWLQLNSEDRLLKRSILLRNKTTNLLYAESYFVIDRLPKTMHRQLLETDQPIGLLWRAERMETYREISRYTRGPDLSLAKYFNVSEDAEFLGRTYHIYFQRQPLGMITEKFPITYFK